MEKKIIFKKLAEIAILGIASILLLYSSIAYLMVDVEVYSAMIQPRYIPADGQMKDLIAFRYGKTEIFIEKGNDRNRIEALLSGVKDPLLSDVEQLYILNGTIRELTNLSGKKKDLFGEYIYRISNENDIIFISEDTTLSFYSIMCHELMHLRNRQSGIYRDYELDERLAQEAEENLWCKVTP